MTSSRSRGARKEPSPAVLPSHLAGLMNPGAYPHAVEAVSLVETHVSWVLLTGELAYKIKRPVRYPFVDLRPLERRKFFCEEELRLNRRFAGELYLDVRPITAGPAGARIGGEGEAIEYAVCMRQFDREQELDRLLAGGRIAPEELAEFGREIAAIHDTLPVAAASQPFGHPASIRGVVLGNVDECAVAAESCGTQAEIRALREPLAALLGAAEEWMSRRLASGRVRECHGDLHSRNVVRLGSRLTAFDCMEFEPAFRWIDVADEVAFLFADLSAEGYRAQACQFLNGYFSRGGDYEACRYLRLYAAHRALVRAKVAALNRANAGESEARAAALRIHAGHLDFARAMLVDRTPRLILISGLSGSGKTWLAQRLAPALGAIHVRSDVERKRLAGYAERQRSGSGLGEGLYTSDRSARVYERLVECADSVLAGGFPVLVDATFLRRADRERFRPLAERHGLRAHLVRCHAAQDVLERRIRQRGRAGADASEADLSVLAWQQSRLEPVQDDEGWDVIDADTAKAGFEDDIARRLGAAGGG